VPGVSIRADLAQVGFAVGFPVKIYGVHRIP
jgi:hypothetical protein